MVRTAIVNNGVAFRRGKDAGTKKGDARMEMREFIIIVPRE
jgi:hypothetical protein